MTDKLTLNCKECGGMPTIQKWAWITTGKFIIWCRNPDCKSELAFVGNQHGKIIEEWNQHQEKK